MHSMANYIVLQVGRSLYLLGKHRAAVEVYDEALKLECQDWELWFNKGMCASQMKAYDRWAHLHTHAQVGLSC